MRPSGLLLRGRSDSSVCDDDEKRAPGLPPRTGRLLILTLIGCEEVGKDTGTEATCGNDDRTTAAGGGRLRTREVWSWKART